MIHPYGLILGLSFFLGYYYFQHHTTLRKSLQDSLFYGLITFGIIGARLYHVLDQWSYYSANIQKIPQVWLGGLGIYGAVFFGLFFVIYFAKKNQLNLLNLLNQISPSIPLMQAIGRWGNFVNREVYGPQGQPVWLYESILCLMLFLYLNFSKSNALAKYLIGYGIIRFCLEFLRTDTWQIDQFKIAQIISLAMVAIGFIIIKCNQKNSSKS